MVLFVLLSNFCHIYLRCYNFLLLFSLILLPNVTLRISANVFNLLDPEFYI